MMDRQYTGDGGYSNGPYQPYRDAASVSPLQGGAATTIPRSASVASGSTAPEAVPQYVGLEPAGAYPGLEVVPERSPPPQFVSAGGGGAAVYPSGKELSAAHATQHMYYQNDIAESQQGHSEQPPPPRPFWRWKRTWAAVAVVILVIIAVVVGVVVGLRASDGGGGGGASSPAETQSGSPTTSGSNPASTAAPAVVPTGTSACTSTVCGSQVLAALTDTTSSGNSANSPVVHLFARGSDATFKQATSQPGGSSFVVASGSSTAVWESRGGTINGDRGAVSALLWTPQNGNPTITVFGLNAQSNVTSKSITLATGVQSSFVGLDGWNAAGPPSVCKVASDRIDLWITHRENGKGDRVLHRYVDRERGTFNNFWDGAVANKSDVESRVGVVCRDSEASHDLVVYARASGGGDGLSAWHRQYRSDALGWGNWTDRGGDFLPGSEPVALEVSANRFDFFGLGADKQIHHWSWSSSAEYTTAESLGGSFASVPAAVVSGSRNDRVDVVAVAENGHLMHRALIGTDWGSGGSDWEDLGVSADAPPQLVRINATAVGMFMIAVDRSAWWAPVTITQDRSWGTLAWRPLPGL